MASFQKIEFELQAINDATFQQLCDEHLLLSERRLSISKQALKSKGKKKSKERNS